MSHLCLVVGEGHGEVDHEAQDHVLVVAEAPGQRGGVAGQRPCSVLVVPDAGGVGAQVAPPQIGQNVLVEVLGAGGPGCVGVAVGVDE